MQETNRSAMQQYLSDQLAACKAREKQLAQEQRSDEATLARIEGNIYKIFSTVWGVACREADDVQAPAFFRARLEQIPQSWRGARETALAHGDAERAHIETVKLAAVQNISDALDRMTEARNDG